MSVDIHYDSSEPMPELTLDGAKELFDNSITAFFAACRAYSSLPVARNLQTAMEAANETSRAWILLTTSILEDERLGAAEKAKMLVALIESSDQNRVDSFEGITGKENVFEAIPQEGFTELLIDVLEEGECNIYGLVNELQENYATKTSTDLNKLIEQIESSLTWRSVKALQKLGGHAVDVTKVAVGAAIGGYMALRWANRKTDK